MEFKEAGFRRPNMLRPNPRTNRNNFYKWHKSVGHYTEDFWHLKDCTEQLICPSKLQHFIKSEGTRESCHNIEVVEDGGITRDGLFIVSNMISGVPLVLTGSTYRSGKMKIKEVGVIAVGTLSQ